MTFRWATVTDDSPFRIRFDGPGEAELDLTPDSLVDPMLLSVGDRVRAEISDDGLVVVYGKANGAAARETHHTVANLAALDAIDGLVGDTAWMTAPGSGITAMMWEAFAGSGTGTDWRPAGDVYASSSTNLTNFIAAVAAIADTRFRIGGRAVVTLTNGPYHRFFTSTAGALTSPVFYKGSTVRRRAAANLATSGSVAVLTTGTSVRDPGDFTYSAGTLTCVTAGTYRITVTVDFAGNAAGARTAGIWVNAGAAGTVYQQPATITSLALTLTITTVVALVAGDTVAPVGQQNAAANLLTAASIELELVA